MIRLLESMRYIETKKKTKLFAKIKKYTHATESW